MAADLVLSALDDVVSEDAWEEAGQYLQSVVLSSENSESSHKKVRQPDRLAPTPAPILRAGPCGPQTKPVVSPSICYV